MPHDQDQAEPMRALADTEPLDLIEQDGVGWVDLVTRLAPPMPAQR
jgi:hypothetical protein